LDSETDTAPMASRSGMFYQDDIVNLNVTDAGAHQAFLVASVLGGANPIRAAQSLYTQIARALLEIKKEIFHERIFGSLSAEQDVRSGRRAALVSQNIEHGGPVTYIQGNPPWGEGLAGVIIQAVSTNNPSEKTWTIREKEIACGRGWKKGDCTYLVLHNIQSLGGNRNTTYNAANQASQMIDRARNILESQGASYRDVVRTWFYLSDILGWYDEFNRARNERYSEIGIMPGSRDKLMLPASTGIRGDNSQGAMCAMDLLAIVGSKDARPYIRRMSSVRQKDAFCYGSSFSRGVFIGESDTNLIQVSGTAAIDKEGKSLHPNDSSSQIACTLDNVEALIGQEGALLSDIAAATVFVKRPRDAEVFWEIAQSRGLNEFPGICIVADVCRDELLFEMDAEAAFNKQC
jgi:enamine deaminase RidA (YjgF/YER057c/UK114 family)